jgi:hypothetical protein
MSDLFEKLKKALKPTGAAAPTGSLIHENEVSILQGAAQVLSKSDTGKQLLDFAKENGIAVHVLRNKENFGILSSDSTVYISSPAGHDLPPLRGAIYLAGALRQAQQETEDGLKRPKPANTTKDQYVRTYVQKNKDILWHQSAVVYELAKVNGLSQIVDEFTAMGYLSLYEAYQEDVNSQDRP